MEEGDVFGVVSEFFWHPQAQAWAEFADRDSWGDFLDALVNMTGDREARYLPALAVPLPLERQRTFAVTCLTGGLPTSAVPVESLYATPGQRLDLGGAGAGACYLQQPAAYMVNLTRRLGLHIPMQFADCPDHLALELDMMGLLVSSGDAVAASDFARSRFCWLSAYRECLANDPINCSFHVALLDAVMDAVRAWEVARRT